MSPLSTGETIEHLSRLRRIDADRLLFGATAHQYRVGPPLPSAHIAQLEAEYAIKLPGDYVEFLTAVGNGGAGPGYGLERFMSLTSRQAVPKPPRIEKRKRPGSKHAQPTPCDDAGNELDRWDFSYFDSAAAYAPDGELGRKCLTRAFPLSAPFRCITDHMWDVQIPNWDAAIKAGHAGNRQRFAEIPVSDGALRIAHYGSGIYAVIVLNGPFRGQIWIHEPNVGDYVPASMRIDLHDTTVKVEHSYHHHQKAPSFSDWYAHWLVTAEPEVHRLKEEAIRLSKKNTSREVCSGTGELIASGEIDGMEYHLYAAPPPETDSDQDE